MQPFQRRSMPLQLFDVRPACMSNATAFLWVLVQVTHPGGGIFDNWFGPNRARAKKIFAIERVIPANALKFMPHQAGDAVIHEVHIP